MWVGVSSFDFATIIPVALIKRFRRFVIHSLNETEDNSFTRRDILSLPRSPDTCTLTRIMVHVKGYECRNRVTGYL